MVSGYYNYYEYLKHLENNYMFYLLIFDLNSLVTIQFLVYILNFIPMVVKFFT